MAAPTDGGVPDVTAGIPEIEDEHASVFGRLTGVGRRRPRRLTAAGGRPGAARRVAYGGHRKMDGAESLVDTSIRQRPYDDAEVTEVQIQV
ncbi:hypothetical protein C4B68_32090 [Streptomyces dengpaensis]|uniref:Uncharacterized protein n=1 Tax=Streptomyces dengpaensis TaxID=2049881 RepID=A0ABM6SYC3_9ACTN|nr:hypothetical protein C4B68_32090 [Streptomyces dengpaensis]PIB06888.1 hypothetical protein B1C81_22760 [Streptomyces sp. HG99]